MTPIYMIMKAVYFEGAELERIAGRLNHHGLTITVSNGILSDCGDNWIARLSREQKIVFQHQNQQ